MARRPLPSSVIDNVDSSADSRAVSYSPKPHRSPPPAQPTADGEPPTGASGLGAGAIVGAVVGACVALGVSVAYAARARRIKARRQHNDPAMEILKTQKSALQTKGVC